MTINSIETLVQASKDLLAGHPSYRQLQAHARELRERGLIKIKLNSKAVELHEAIDNFIRENTLQKINETIDNLNYEPTPAPEKNWKEVAEELQRQLEEAREELNSLKDTIQKLSETNAATPAPVTKATTESGLVLRMDVVDEDEDLKTDSRDLKEREANWWRLKHLIHEMKIVSEDSYENQFTHKLDAIAGILESAMKAVENGSEKALERQLSNNGVLDIFLNISVHEKVFMNDRRNGPFRHVSVYSAFCFLTKEILTRYEELVGEKKTKAYMTERLKGYSKYDTHPFLSKYIPPRKRTKKAAA